MDLSDGVTVKEGYSLQQEVFFSGCWGWGASFSNYSGDDKRDEGVRKYGISIETTKQDDLEWLSEEKNISVPIFLKRLFAYFAKIVMSAVSFLLGWSIMDRNMVSEQCSSWVLN